MINGEPGRVQFLLDVADHLSLCSNQTGTNRLGLVNYGLPNLGFREYISSPRGLRNKLTLDVGRPISDRLGQVVDTNNVVRYEVVSDTAGRLRNTRSHSIGGCFDILSEA